MENLQGMTKETIDLVKASYASGPSAIAKAGISTGTGLFGYPLEAPSKKLYPVLSPLRNRIPRMQARTGGDATHWRAITGINTANLEASVAFGVRNSAISYAEVDKLATFKSLGLDDVVQDEAVWMGRNFEDVRALSAIALLQSVMVEEEKVILGGNVTNLATPSAPTVTDSATGGSIGAGTFNVAVVALPLYGKLNSSLSALSRHSLASATAASSALTGSTNTISATVPLVSGAVAYAWFVGLSGAEKLEKITTINSAKFLSLAGTGQALSAIVSNTSGHAQSFDGIIPQLLAGSAIVVDQATGVPGVGTGLTADGVGGIKEFDSVLQQLWDGPRIAPTLIIVNSQEALAITRKIGGSSALGMRVNLSDGQNNVVGGIFVNGYLNKFASTISQQSGSVIPDVIPVMTHPYLPAGTVLFLSERLPYPNNNVPNTIEVETLQEYADFEWARTQRQYEHGIYCNEVLKLYFPGGCAMIRNVANDA